MNLRARLIKRFSIFLRRNPLSSHLTLTLPYLINVPVAVT